MRDVVLTIFIFGTLPFILKMPWIGVLMSAWISYMTPHKLAWGFARGMPFALAVAAVTMIAFLISSEEKKRIPITPITVVLLVFVFWTCVTTFFALSPEPAQVQWKTFMKIQVLNLLTLAMITDKKRLNLLVGVIVFSFGFMAVKGGLFTVLTGGGSRVYGIGGFVADNNALGLALLTTLPFMRYFQLNLNHKWARLGFGLLMVATMGAIIGTYSRGALLGGAAMLGFLWLKSRYKLVLAITFVGALVPLITFMPQKWSDRMVSIGDYKTDGSAQGRIDAWIFAINIANARPFIGGGFKATQNPRIFFRYNPDAFKARAAHSIWFEVLGDHGWVGLILFVTLGVMTFRSAGWVRKRTRGHGDLTWAYDLGGMIQVSLVGFASAGTFLNMSTFDLYYHVITVTVVLRVIVEKELAARGEGKRKPIRFHEQSSVERAPI